MVLGRPHRFDLEAARSILGLERPVIGDRQRVAGEREQPHLPANAVGGPDLRNHDAIGRHRSGKRQVAAGAAALAALAAAAALAASSAISLRCLRGIALVGLLRAVRLRMSSSSRKRMTRSVGCAPLASQLFTLSTSSLRRSLASFSSNGLK